MTEQSELSLSSVMRTMAMQSSSEQSQCASETVVPQSPVQQPLSATASQTHPVRPMSEVVVLQQTDLTTSGLTEDDVPPPAYGETYGEIRDENNGLGTSARVAEDGRVNIRINQSNRRLSQVFTPALRKHVQSVQYSRPPPLPYIPSSLGGEKIVTPPPSLNVVIQVVGSRGDVQPFVALAKVLKDTYGHRVRLATHPIFENLVLENGLEFFSIGGDPSRLMAFMVKNPGLMPGVRTLLSGDVSQQRKHVAEYIQGCWRSCYKTGDGMGLRSSHDHVSVDSAHNIGSVKPFVADCIIANPPSFAHIHCAEKLGIPLHIMFTMPYSPTQAFPHPLANIRSSNADPQLTNYLSYAMIEVLSWQGLGDLINRFRAKCLGLDPVSMISAPGMLQRLKVPHTYCWSPSLLPKPEDWGDHISVSGYCLLKTSDYTPTPDLQAFLDAGPPPVYIGFGSIVLDDPNALTMLVFKAARKIGQRVLLSRGWGGIGADEFRIPDGVFMLGNVPHDWLFKHVSCVVHHGGAGTTAAGITEGRPTVIVPFFGDQPFWGAIVARAGAGPDPIPYTQLTAEKLADAIKLCLKPESLERAKRLAGKIAKDRGNDAGAQTFHQQLEVDRLRCALAPTRPATWRIKRTKIGLSAFAACTLVNADLLDLHDLKLSRAQEYYTDKGPLDPLSGGATALVGAFSNMVVGVADLPTETWRALQMPFGSSRQLSQSSASLAVRESESSYMGESSTSPISPQQSQKSLDIQEPLAPARSLSGMSTLSSNNASSSMADAFQDKLRSKKDGPKRSRLRNRNESRSDRDLDMLGPGLAHTTKGFGRIVKAAVSSPVHISVGFVQGFHNAPKLWGDDTVRPQEKVDGVVSGFKAVGKEFGYGMYDGVTGVVTQPWKGAQKEGATGFIKGIGKGIGGFVAKPGAALFGIPAYFMKGIHKEVQNLFGADAQNSIVASRVAQGHEEWLQSSDAEKKDVIARWRLIQKYLKKKDNRDELVRDVLQAQRDMNRDGREAQQDREAIARSAQSAGAHATTMTPERAVLAMGGAQPSADLLGTAGVNESTGMSAQNTSHVAVEGTNLEQGAQRSLSPLRRRRQKSVDTEAVQENLRQAMAASEAEAQRHVSEALGFEKQLKRVMAQSLTEQRQSSSDGEWSLYTGLDDEEDDEFEREVRQSEKMVEKAAAVAIGSPAVQRTPSYDPGHLVGTTQSEFEAQRQGQSGEKTTQERTEEEIVMEYVKKQSLLEIYHQNEGKSRVKPMEDTDIEDLQKAFDLSMREHKHNAGYRNGEAPSV